MLTDLLSRVIGIPEPTVRLLASLLLAYPAGYYYPKGASGKEKRRRYILGTGLAIAFFFNGLQIYHSILTVFGSYGLCVLLGQQRMWAAGAVWLLNAVYLLVGYYYMETDEYDITWTMTQCILCLRMMGFAFDFYDGQKAAQPKPGPLPLSFQSNTPLAQLPDLQDLMAYAFFPAALIVGPQFSFSLFHAWLSTPPVKTEETDRAQKAHIMRCLTLALVYLGIQQLFGNTYSTQYLLTDQYRALAYPQRFFYFTLAGKLAFNKYIGIWLLNEGAVTYFGISFDGLDQHGLARFDGLANVDPVRFETATSIDHVISAFNINTNLWSKYYVFKRLKFLGNKAASQFGTLAFLAIWHGFHLVYPATFLLEFLFVKAESVLRQRVQINTQNEFARLGLSLASWLLCQATIAYGVVGFELLKSYRAYQAYQSVGFIGHWIIILLLVADHYLPPKKKKTNK